MKIIGIIPARLAAERLPNKPLKDIHGMPMLGHVYHRSLMCKDLHELYVTTCDEKIASYIKSIGGKVIMTSDKHKRAIDRAAEATKIIEEQTKEETDIVVVIAGDEPMITDQMIANALSPMIIDETLNIVNLMTEIKNIEEFNSPDSIKVVVDINNYALYFSREPIPSRKKGASGFPMLKRVGVMPIRRDFLFEFSKMIPTPLEIVESIALMRIIENGIRVKMVFSETLSYSVDSMDDLEFVKEKMKTDYLTKKYLTNPN